MSPARAEAWGQHCSDCLGQTLSSSCRAGPALPVAAPVGSSWRSWCRRARRFGPPPERIRKGIGRSRHKVLAQRLRGHRRSGEVTLVRLPRTKCPGGKTPPEPAAGEKAGRTVNRRPSRHVEPTGRTGVRSTGRATTPRPLAASVPRRAAVGHGPGRPPVHPMRIRFPPLRRARGEPGAGRAAPQHRTTTEGKSHQ